MKSHDFKYYADNCQIYISSINRSSEGLCISDFNLDRSTLIAMMLHKLSITNTIFSQTYNVHILPYLSKDKQVGQQMAQVW